MAGNTRNRALADFATTLLILVASRTAYASLQIGDGFIVGRLEGEQSFSLLCTPYEGQYSNDVMPLTSANWTEAVSRSNADAALAFASLGSDGLEYLVLDWQEKRPANKVFIPYEGWVRDHPVTAAAALLSDHLSSDARITAKVDDDVSLLIMAQHATDIP
jgi:hypothetical protein